MDFVGLDPSLAGTGFVKLSTEFSNFKCEVLHSDPALPIGKRLHQIAGMCYYSCLTSSEVWVAVEQPILHMNGALDRGALYGAILSTLSMEMAPTIESVVRRILLVAPSQLKKFATSRGGAQKDEIRVEVYKRWKFEHESNDVVDAFVLAKIAQLCHWLSQGIDTTSGDDVTWTQFQREVAEKVLAQGGARDGRKKRTRRLPGVSRATR